METSNSKEFIILGAGLAGLVAAINLSRAGFKVKIYEKKNFVGQHEKETVQLLPNWFSKEDVIGEIDRCGIKTKWLNKISEIEIYFGEKRKLTLKSKKFPIGYTVLRGGDNSFEKDLAQEAKTLGVEIILGRKPDKKPDIIATGCGKILTIGYGRVYKGDFEPQKAKVFLTQEHSPSVGYAYLFPHNKKLATFKISKRIGETLDFKEKLKEIQNQYLRKELKEENLLYEFGSKRSFGVPKTAIQDGSILVGEAAGFQDELFRFGMRYAIISGYLAAQALAKNLDYDKLWKKSFASEFQKTSRVRKVFEAQKKIRFDFFPEDTEIIMDIENFRKIWLSPRLNMALFLYPIFGRFFSKRLIKPLLNIFLKLGVLTKNY